MNERTDIASPESNWHFGSFLLRFLPAFGAMIVLFYFIGPAYVRFYLPIFANQLELMHPEYDVTYYEMVKLNDINYIRYTVRINKAAANAGPGAEMKGNSVRLKGQASSLCVAPVIVFTLILAWPLLSFRNRLKAFLLSLPLLFIITCLDLPMIFISHVESAYSSSLLKIKILDVWAHILNNGGRQFLALVVFLLSMAPVYLEFEQNRRPAAGADVGRNAPCPCGSGKKFKHCCLQS